MMTQASPATSPVTAAAAAAEALDVLNGLTTPDLDGYSWPADVDAVVVQLQLVAVRLTRAFAQAGQWLNDAGNQGLVRDVRGINPHLTLAGAQELLARALTQAGAVASTLDLAHQHTAHLAGLVKPAQGGDE